MGCRCSDIPRCSSDIRRVENISSLFTKSDGTNDSVTGELSGLSTECILAFSCKNIQKLTTEEKKLNKTLTELLPNLIKRSESKVHSLKQELRSMKREDTEYHEEEARRRRESSSHHHHD